MKRIVTVCNEIDFEKLVNPTGRFVMGGSFADCGATGRKSAYAIGVVESVSMAVDCFGSEYQNPEFIRAYVRENYDLTPRGIVRSASVGCGLQRSQRLRTLQQGVLAVGGMNFS